MADERLIEVNEYENQHVDQYTVSNYNKENNDNISWDFVLDSDTADVYTNFSITNSELKLTSDEAQEYSKRWNNFNIYSFVFLLTDRPFYGTFTTNYLVYDKLFLRIKGLIYNEQLANINSDTNMLAVLERSENKGWHLHLLLFLTTRTSKKNLLELQDVFSKFSVHYHFVGCNQLNQHTWDTNFIVSAQIIKSPGSYFHYLRKCPLAIFSNNIDLLKMFLNFNRTHIFPSTSVPKYQKAKTLPTLNTKNPVLTLLFNFFSEGILDFTSVMKDNRIQPFLTTPNLRSIFENAFLNYSANLNHIKNLIQIVNKFLNLEPHQRCACPILEYLQYQNIEKEHFLEKLFKWLNCSEKRNALWLFGPPDCGKSHLGRALWNCFILNKRINSDGIFSFSELDGAGCALWDEPFINAEMADQTKLVLEGQPDVMITKKGKAPFKLHKRVPMIITSNTELSKYCSSDFEAFQVRTYRFNCYNTINPLMFCNADFHYCPSIDAPDSEYNPFKNSGVRENKRRRTSEEGIFNCKGYHPVLNNHAISIIVLSLVLYRENFIIDKNIPLEDHCTLANKLTECEELFCTCTKTLTVHIN